MAEKAEPTSWHLDKKVPVTLIIVLVGQLITGIWWSAKLDARIEDHERRILAEESLSRDRVLQDRSNAERLARIEEKLTAFIEELRRNQPR